MTYSASNHARRAFSLIETVVSLSVMSIIMLSLGSVVMIAARTVPNPDEAIHAELELARVMADLERDLVYATGLELTYYTSVDIEVLSIVAIDAGKGLGLEFSDLVSGLSQDKVNVARATDLKQMRIQIPSGNDGLGSIRLGYQLDPKTPIVARKIAGDNRDQVESSASLVTFELVMQDDIAICLTLELMHSNGVTGKTLVVEFKNKPRVVVL